VSGLKRYLAETGSSIAMRFFAGGSIHVEQAFILEISTISLYKLPRVLMMLLIVGNLFGSNQQNDVVIYITRANRFEDD
jgi:hypothetical protein